MPAVEHRRRTRPSEATTDPLTPTERTAVGLLLADTHNKKKKQQQQQQQQQQQRQRSSSRRKLQWWERHELSDFSLMMCCLGVGMVVYTVRSRTIHMTNVPSLRYTTYEFRSMYQASRSQIANHKRLYDEIYRLKSERLKPPDQTEWPDYERRPYELKAQYQYGINVPDCSLTVVVLEPHLGKPLFDFGPGQPLWFELESMASAIPDDACVTLQTTTCSMKEYLGAEATEESAVEAIVKTIYDCSLPLFRRTIESGRVRISFLDYHEYNVRMCQHLENPSVVFLNANYWREAFVDADSDTVLIHQAGSTFCYPLTDLTSLKEYAMVGSLWPKDHHPMVSDPLEGACRGMPMRWKNWLHPQRRWKMDQDKPDLLAAKHGAVPKPKEFFNEDFPKICENGRGPIGHGSLSLRSRKWMIKAIESCPHTMFSGLNVDEEPYGCKVFDSVSHDMYFATILEGIRAPMPLALEASLFSTELFWPEDVWLLYGVPHDKTFVPPPTAVRRPERPIVDRDKKEGIIMTVPNVVVQPWLFHAHEFLLSKPMENACPYLSYTFSPTQHVYEETNAPPENEWAGVGH